MNIYNNVTNGTRSFCRGLGAPDLGVLGGNALAVGFKNCIQHSLVHGQLMVLH